MASIVGSLMEYNLVVNGHRTGAIVEFVPDERVLSSILDMSNNFIILNKNAPTELKDLMESLPKLWKEDQASYHIALGRIMGYTEPIDINATPTGKRMGVGIMVKGTYKGTKEKFQIAPQWVSEQNLQQAIDTLSKLKPHVEGTRIPGFEIDSVTVYDDHTKAGGMGRKRTRRRR